MHPRITVIGSFVAGITIRVSRPPVRGETVVGDKFNLGPGGKGFNQALAAARAGASVNILLCTGKDMFSTLARKGLIEEGISTHLINEIEHIHSGCGLVTLLPDGENSIIIDPGANGFMSQEMVERASNEIQDAQVLMAQLEVPDAAIESAFSLGRKYGCMTILNPAPARKISERILRNVDILTPNESEARILAGFSSADEIPIGRIGSALLQLGVTTIVITRGKSGAVIITPQGTAEIKALEVAPVDSTGAGDCFNGNLAFGLASGLSLEKAVERAVHAGTYATLSFGVIDGLPTGAALDRFIQERAADVDSARYYKPAGL